MMKNDFGFMFNEEGIDEVVTAAFLEVEDVRSGLEAAGVKVTDENVRAFADWVSPAFTDYIYERMPDLMGEYARSWDCDRRESAYQNEGLANLEQSARSAARGMDEPATDPCAQAR